MAHSLYSLVESASRQMATNKEEMGAVLSQMHRQFLDDNQPPEEVKELGWAQHLLEGSPDLETFLSQYRQVVGTGVNPKPMPGDPGTSEPSIPKETPGSPPPSSKKTSAPSGKPPNAPSPGRQVGLQSLFKRQPRTPTG